MTFIFQRSSQGRILEYVGFAVWFFFPKFLTTCSARVGSIWELRVSRPFTVRVYPPSPLFSYQHADSIASPYLPRNPISKLPSISSSPVPPLANSASKTYPLKQTPPSLQYPPIFRMGISLKSKASWHCFCKTTDWKSFLSFPPPQNSQPFETQISSRANVHGEPLQPRRLVQQDYRTSAYREDKNTWRFIITGNRVARFPHKFAELVNLRELDCRRNLISDLGRLQTLPAEHPLGWP